MGVHNIILLKFILYFFQLKSNKKMSNSSSVKTRSRRERKLVNKLSPDHLMMWQKSKKAKGKENEKLCNKGCTIQAFNIDNLNKNMQFFSRNF